MCWELTLISLMSDGVMVKRRRNATSSLSLKKTYGIGVIVTYGIFHVALEYLVTKIVMADGKNGR